MNFIFYSPNFPDNSAEFCYELKQYGCNVLGIGDADYFSLNEKLKASLTEYYKVNDGENYDEIFRAVAYFTHKYGKIDRFESLNEYWLELEAKIRTDFNIYGTKSDFVPNIIHKSKMKLYFEKSGVNTIRSLKSSDITLVRNFINTVHYPIVIKPDLGSGASNTFKINNNFELAQFFHEKPDELDFIVEEFIDGIILTYDGLIDKDGVVRLSTSHEFDQSIMEVVNKDSHLNYYCLKTIAPEIETAGKKILKAFDIRERFFHIELFKCKKDGRIVALEVNMRPPGAWMTDAINFTYDINIYKEWANLVVNNTVGGPYLGKYYTGYASRKNHIKYMHTQEDIFNAYGDRIVNHGEIANVFSRAMGNRAYQFRSTAFEEVREIVKFIQLEER